jgi:hypothetical protein
MRPKSNFASASRKSSIGDFGKVSIRRVAGELSPKGGDEVTPIQIVEDRVSLVLLFFAESLCFWLRNVGGGSFRLSNPNRTLSVIRSGPGFPTSQHLTAVTDAPLFKERRLEFLHFASGRLGNTRSKNELIHRRLCIRARL